MESNGLGMSVRASAHRVIRGGSWTNNAQNVRRRPATTTSPRTGTTTWACAVLTHDGAGRLPQEQTGVLSVVSGDGECCQRLAC